MKLLNIYDIYKAYEDLKGEGNTTKIASAIDDVYKDSSAFMTSMASTWDEVINFYVGNQHIEYNSISKGYQAKPLTKYNSFIPRPVNNITFQYINTLVAMLTKNRPQSKTYPNSDKQEDKNRAKMTDTLMDAKYEIDGELEKFIKFVKIAVMLGTAYRKDWWDSSGLQTIKVNTDKGPTELPLGDNRVSILSPFQLIVDYANAIDDVDDGNYTIESNVYSLEFIKNKFDKEGDGYTGEAKGLVADKNLSLRMDFLERMKGQISSSNTLGEKPSDDSCVLHEVYIRPIEKHELGLQIFVCNGKLLYIAPCPYTYGEARSWNPYTQYTYQKHPFRHYGIGAGEIVVPFNKRLNSLEALIILNRKTMAIPQWVAPQGSLSPEQQPTGAPGQIISAKPINGVMPSKVPGIGLDPSVYREKEQVISESAIRTGINDIMTGNQPSGVNTATAMQILLEQTNNNFNTILQSLSKFYERAMIKKANLIRRKYREPRASLINRIKALNSATTQVMINDLFTGEDLGDNIDIRVEADSMLPRSEVVMQKSITDALGQGLYGDVNPLTNPAGNANILKKLNLPEALTPSGGDVKRSDWENSCIRQKQFDQVVVLPTDNPLIHYLAVKREIDEPEFTTNYEEAVQDAYMEHLLNHFIDLDQSMYPMVGLTMGTVKDLVKKIEMSGNQDLIQKAMDSGLIPPPMPMNPDGTPITPEQMATTGQVPEEALAPAGADASASGSVDMTQNSPGMA